MSTLALYSEWDTSFLELLDKNGKNMDEEENKDKIKQYIQLLIKITDNIIKNPMDEKYRKLKKTNAALNKAIFSLDGGERSVLALGFTLIGEELLVLEPSSEKWENLVRANNKLKGFLVRFNSPSMITTSSSPNISSNTTTATNTTTNSTNSSDMQEFMTFFQAAALRVAAGTTSTSTSTPITTTTTTITTDTDVASTTDTTITTVVTGENNDDSVSNTEKDKNDANST